MPVLSRLAPVRRHVNLMLMNVVLEQWLGVWAVVDARGHRLPGALVLARAQPVRLTRGAHQLFGRAGDGSQEHRADVVAEHRTVVEGPQRLTREGGQILRAPAVWSRWSCSPRSARRPR
jgi:hypothetical protein